MKRFIFKCTLLMICVLTIFSSVFTVNASTNLKENNDEVYINEKLMTSLSSANENNLMSSNSNYEWLVLNHDSFRVYHTNEFSQFSTGNNCGPTVAANILSYHKSLGYNLYSGEITQSIYDEIADLMYFTSQGAPFGFVYRAVEEFAERAGYQFEHDVYLLDLWSDVTRDIRYGYSVIAGKDKHVYLVLGYREIDGVKALYTCTNWENPEFQWINFDGAGFQMESMYIHY